MKVQELIDKWLELGVSGDEEVRVSAFGGMRRGKAISRTSLGFDWDSGAVILHPEVQLTIHHRPAKPDPIAYKPHQFRIQRKRTKGFKLPSGAICITRPGPWGNPFRRETAIETGFCRVASEANKFCVECFEDWLLKGDLSEWWFAGGTDAWKFMRANLSELEGEQLACFCPLDQPCHGDVLARLANGN